MNILNVDFLSELGSIDIINDYAICHLLRSKIHIWQCKSTVFAGYVNYYQQFTNHVKSHQWLCQVLWTHSHRHSFNCWSLLRADIAGSGPCLQPQYQGFKNIIPYSYLLWVRFIVVYFLGPCSAPLLRTEILAIMAIFSLSKMNQLLWPYPLSYAID